MDYSPPIFSFGGGFAGGKIVGTGTPEEIAELEKSYTGQYLKEVL